MKYLPLVNRVERESVSRSLHIFVLSGFGVAQPIYDLLGRNAEFFVAHRAGIQVMLGFVLAISVGIPALLVVIEAIIARIAPTMGEWIHLFFVSVLAALIPLPIVAQFGLPAWFPLVSGVGLGLAFALIYAKATLVRHFLTVLSPAVVLFPAIFLFFTPVSGLMSATASKIKSAEIIPNPVPIVLIVLDEMNATALLDAKRQIDASRYPNFAALGRDAYWFRRATAAHWVTQHALPAIVTGRRPKHDTQRLPTAADYPENLFSWLSDTYDFNVFEPLTSLCPVTRCGDARETFDAWVFMSDVVIVYLHRILPRRFGSALLPPLTHTWKGFSPQPKSSSAATDPKARLSTAFRESVVGDRRDEWMRFLSGISRDQPNTLNFLHILLPHDPYQYLPSGGFYPIQPALGLHSDEVWSSANNLIATEYQRYLLQIGFVDALLGALMERLKTEDLYDESLIIITADHGKSFLEGSPKRKLTKSNAPDLLHVPMLVKLPRQRQGRVSDRRVSGIDILPTISQVLGVQPPWVTHGRSMVAASFTERKVVNLDGIWKFDSEWLTTFHRLAWQLEKFGTATPLDHLTLKGPHHRLIGEQVNELEVLDPTPDLRVQSDVIHLFDHVDPKSGFLPALITGQVSVGKERRTMLDLAIALNGEVRATTTTTDWAGNPAYFAVMIPQAAFRMGKNDLRVFLVEGKDPSPTLIRIPFAGDRISIGRNTKRKRSLVLDDGREVPVQSQAVKGWLESVQQQGPLVSMRGWAADIVNTQPVDFVVVFPGNASTIVTKPQVERKDLVRKFGKENLKRSGFVFHVPAETLASAIEKVQLFGVSAHGIAGELYFGEEAQRSLDHIRNRSTGTPVSSE